MTQPKTPHHPIPLLMLSSATMELSWMSALTGYATHLICGHAFPMSMAIVAFILSATLTIQLERAKRPRWHLLALHLIAAVLALAIVLTLSHYRFMVLLPAQWLEALQAQPKTISQWVTIIFAALCLLLFWISGLLWCRRPSTHQTICNRFDLGASSLFILFLIKLMLAQRLAVVIDTFEGFYTLGCFFISGLLSIGLAKNQYRLAKKPEGFKGGISLLLLFILVIMIFGLSTGVIFLPYTEGAAQSGFNPIKTIMSPVLSKALKLMTWLFQTSSDAPTHVGTRDDTGPVQGQAIESILSENNSFMHGAMLGYVIMGILLLAGAVWMLWRWLNTRAAQKKVVRAPSWLPWIKQLLWQAAMALIDYARRRRSQKNIVYYYTALIKWGKYSGIIHRANETPKEYARRLEKQFPAVKTEVANITDRFNECIYGDRPLSAVDMAELHKAKKKIGRPRLWPMRIRSKLTSGYSSTWAFKADIRAP